MAAALRILVEIWQMYYAGVEYFLDITNYMEWFLYAFAIIFVIDIDIQNDDFDFTEPASKRTVSLQSKSKLIPAENLLNRT